MGLPLYSIGKAIVVLLLLLLVNADAQNQEGPASGRDKAMRTLFLENMLLHIGREVREDLRLTPQQVNAIGKYHESAERYTLGAHWIEACQRDLKGIFSHLNEHQRHRYHQLLFQYRGALRTFLIPKIAEELKLTSDQARQLEELYEIYESGVNNLNAYEVKLLQSEYSQGKFSASLKGAADKMAESVLTPDQHLLWRGMQGRPIEPRPRSW